MYCPELYANNSINPKIIRGLSLRDIIPRAVDQLVLFNCIDIWNDTD